jgi:hypothetical protein
MTNPLTPNYVPGVGQLVTYRSDFESHILGTNFRHSSDQINVASATNPAYPAITITGQSIPAPTVWDAITQLNAAITPYVTPTATPSRLGTVQLAGDLGGVGTQATSPRVSGLQGRPVQNLSPSTGDVLTWSGSLWGPSPSVSFIPGGDLTSSIPSSISLQYVSSVSGPNGNGGAVEMAENTYFDYYANYTMLSIGGTPVLYSNSSNDLFLNGINSLRLHNGTSNEVARFAQSINDFILLGDSASNASSNGLIRVSNNAAKYVIGANRSGYGNYQVLGLDGAGGTVLDTAGSNINMKIAGNNVLRLGAFNSGTGVAFYTDTSTPPSSTPSGGSILYSQNGQFYVYQSNGNFAIGSIPNPSPWPSVSSPSVGTIPANGTITYNAIATSTTAPVTLLTFPCPPSTSFRFDIIFVGKRVGTLDSAQYNYSIGYVTDGSSNPTVIGSLTNADTRTNGTGSSWTPPTTPTISGTNIVLQTGFYTGETINWTAIIQTALVLG